MVQAFNRGVVVGACAAIALTVLALVLSAPVSARQNRQYTYEQITVSTTALGLTASTIAGMQGCVLRAESAGVRYRKDGTAPTDAVGMPLATSDVLEIDHVVDLQRIRFIRSSGSDATLNVECWSSP